MWSSIENLKQNLNKIALDVLDDDDDDNELRIYGGFRNGDDSSVSDRRNSHSFAHSKSPIANGTDSPYNFEIEQCRAEIRRLQESEAEIKALSVNYATLLKEKEDQISRLKQENGSLKKNLATTKEALNTSRNENSRGLPNSITLKGNGDQSPKRQLKSPTQAKNHYAGNQLQNGVCSKQAGGDNGIVHTVQPSAIMNSRGKEKELADLLEEKNRSLAAMQATHELQMKQLKMELEKERERLTNMQLTLEEECKMKESFQEELKKLKLDKNETSMQMTKIHSELDQKISEIRRLKVELSRQEDYDDDDAVKSLKRVIATLERENTSLKMEKSELEAALEISRNSSLSMQNGVDSSGSFAGKAEMESSLQQMERDLKETRYARDKALQELARLKQHLLEKESEESEKMDEDSKIIEGLRENSEYQKAQILQLEKALKQAISRQEEVGMINNNELQKSKELIEELNKKLANCVSIIESKDVELLNLQTALGQYFAEIEAKENLERQLASAREESAKLCELLKDAEIGTEASKREKEEILAKLSYAERILAEGKNRANKLEEDNAKLRRAVEQSMTRLNRMSMDSDYLVDRRIVIKLLVTYFQRNHSKEVLDLMVRMLGFSDEDKQRIGVAQQGGKGVVRGVLGLPGRLVGGILGGHAADVHANSASENQSFADLWVDFLLKETEERERREAMEEAGRPKDDSQGRSPSTAGVGSPVPNHTASGISRPSFLPTRSYSPANPQGNLQRYEHSLSEFSTVPLTSSDSTSRYSRLLQKH